MTTNMTDNERTRTALILLDVESELNRAIAKHPPMHSFHEGYAVILEELDELWDEVKQQHPDREKMRKEAIHVGAMAARFILDLIDKEGE